MLPLSVAIITHNEESRLGRTLSSVASISRDIVVVDSGSTDDTVAVAESFGARVIRKEFTTYNEQRNYALSQCVEPWVLYLNAGDFVSIELRVRLQGIVSGIVKNAHAEHSHAEHPHAEHPHAAIVAYKVLCQSLWLEDTVRFGSLRPKYEYRLFSRGAVEFAPDVNSRGNANPNANPNGFDNPPIVLNPDATTVLTLGKPIVCEVAKTVDAYVARMNRHSDVYAAYLHSQGRVGRPWNTPLSLQYPWLTLRGVAMGLRFTGRFIFEFILRGTFLNRRGGLSQALSQALTPEVVRLKARRRYLDYASIYDVPPFVVEGDTPEDREYDENGRLILRRILISRTDKLGDMVVCVPAMRMLRRMFPDAQIDVLASPYNSDIPQHLPYIDNVYTKGSLGADLPGKRSVDDRDLAETINNNKYDAIIMTMTSPEVTKFASTLKAPYIVSGKHLRVYRHGVRIRRLERFRHQHESEYALQIVRHTNPQLYDSVFSLDRALHYSEADKQGVAEFLDSRNLAPCYCKPNLFQPNHGDGFAYCGMDAANHGSPDGGAESAVNIAGSPPEASTEKSLPQRLVAGIAGVLGISDIPPAVLTTLTGSAGGAIVGGAVVGDAITRREAYSLAPDKDATAIRATKGGVIGSSGARVYTGETFANQPYVDTSGSDCSGCGGSSGRGSSGGDAGSGYIAINIYHAGSSNNASLLTYRKIVLGLTDRGYNVVIIAVPYKPRVYNALVAERYFAGMNGVHIFTDATNILRTAAIIHGAKLYIGSSTGPTHIANALDTPSVIVFRNSPLEMRVWVGRYNHNYHVLIPDRVRATPYIDHVNHLASTIISHSERCLKELY